MPSVAHLFGACRRRPSMEELDTADAVTDLGFAGCSHSRQASKRQVLLVDQETLDSMELRPGIIRENLTTCGLNVNGLLPGERLRVGNALLEVAVAVVCTPCDQLEKIRPGLRHECYGRRGMLCRVVKGGLIVRGDSIERLPKAKSPSA